MAIIEVPSLVKRLLTKLTGTLTERFETRTVEIYVAAFKTVTPSTPIAVGLSPLKSAGEECTTIFTSGTATPIAPNVPIVYQPRVTESATIISECAVVSGSTFPKTGRLATLRDTR